MHEFFYVSVEKYAFTLHFLIFLLVHHVFVRRANDDDAAYPTIFITKFNEINGALSLSYF